MHNTSYHTQPHPIIAKKDTLTPFTILHETSGKQCYKHENIHVDRSRVLSRNHRTAVCRRHRTAVCRRHRTVICVIPFTHFYVWVKDDGSVKLVASEDEPVFAALPHEHGVSHRHLYILAVIFALKYQ